MLALATLASVLGPAAAVRAHIGHEIARAERYIKLDVSGHVARVVVSLTLGAGEGARVLGAADADDDGSVSEAERDSYLARWADGLRVEVPVELDGERIELRWGEPFMDPIGRVTSVPVTVEMVARFELSGGRQTIRVTDAMVRREVYDRTDVAFRTRDGARLIESGAGELDGVTPDLAYGPEFGDGAPVALMAIVESPERPRKLPWPLVASVVGVLGGVAVVVWIVRSRRRR